MYNDKYNADPTVLPMSHPSGLMTRLRNRSSWTWPARIAGVVAIIVFISLLLYQTNTRSLQTPAHSTGSERPHVDPKPPAYSHALESHIAHLREIEKWQVPSGMQVIGLIFYGRRRFVSVLNCYLQRNLVANGGIIDRYHFVVKTDDKDDLAYLQTLLDANPKTYSVQYTEKGGFDYSQMWSSVERGNVYVKIDDDVLFIEDSTIRSIVKTKVEHPEYLIVSANLVVQFSLAWLHYHLGAIHPYLPELKTLKKAQYTSWRKSDLPSWDGPEDWNVDNFTIPEHHRWLPLAPGTGNNDKTPIASVTYPTADSNPGHTNWMIGAQQHYSFLENLEKNELWRYAFDSWNVRYDRLSINLIALMGDDVVDMGPMPEDDEAFMTTIYSKKTGRHIVVDGHGLAVHHAYWVMAAIDGHAGMENTDVLDRYRAYAEENICAL